MLRRRSELVWLVAHQAAGLHATWSQVIGRMIANVAAIAFLNDRGEHLYTDHGAAKHDG
jgi:hypothetical protein